MKRLLMAPAAFLVSAALGAGLVACGNDAPEGTRDRGAADILNYPDGFANVAHKCDGKGHRVYSAGGSDAGVSIAVVDDPTCEGSATP